MIKAINELFDKRIKHQRIKKFSEHSTIRTAIREEPMKLAQYLRGEKERYEPLRYFYEAQNNEINKLDANR